MKLDPVTGKGCENLYRHPKTGVIYFRVYRKGKGRIERSTRTTVLSQAKIVADVVILKADSIAGKMGES